MLHPHLLSCVLPMPVQAQAECAELKKEKALLERVEKVV